MYWWQHGLLTLVVGTGAFTVAQTPPTPDISPSKTPSIVSQTQPLKRLKITITMTNPQDLKVREGDPVVVGQVLADRDAERSRLNSEKKEILNAIAYIEQTPRPILKVALPLTDLPMVSYAEEEAAIQQAELKFSQVQRNYTTTLSNDPFITARANVDFARAGIEQAYREVELQQKKIEAIAQIQGLPPEMLQHETEKLKLKRTDWEKKQAEYEFRTAEYKQVEQQRKETIANLQNMVESTRSELELAQAKLRAAKEKRGHEEYQHQIDVARRAEEANQSALSLSQQNLEREFKLSQLREQKARIEEKLESIVIVRSPYNGIIKRIKTENQTNNTLKVTLSLIPNEL